MGNKSQNEVMSIKDEYGIKPITDDECLSIDTHPEEIEKYFKYLGDKFLVAAIILEAKQKATR